MRPLLLLIASLNLMTGVVTFLRPNSFTAPYLASA